MNDIDRYAITIIKGEFEGEICFRATVRELPDIMEFADTADEAYELARDAIETTAAIFSEKGRVMPTVHPEVDEYSGRVTLRLPKTVHKCLAETAITENVSLNHYLVTLLTSNFGFLHSLKMLKTHHSWEIGNEVFFSTRAPKQTGKPHAKVTAIPIVRRVANLG
jgi:predicted HicB family RNase H-like nuclease